jgi:hypothetical protein
MTAVWLSLILSLSASSLLAQDSKPQDPGGWNKAKWGMKKDAIIAEFDGKPHMAPNPIGEGEDLTLDEFPIGTMLFNVRFVFEESVERGLMEVMLSPNGDQRVFPRPAYSNLLSALTEKYGNPTSTREESLSSGGISRQAEWLLTVTRIRIALSDYGRSYAGFMVLDYKKRVKTSDVI